MKTDALSTTTNAVKPNWVQQLWQLVSAPVGDRPTNNPESASSVSPTEYQTHSQDATNTRSPELAPPEAVIESQTLQAFSDYDDAYEPNNMTFAYLIPDELALLNLPPSQAQAVTAEKKEKADTANEPLSDFVPLELSQLSKQQAA